MAQPKTANQTLVREMNASIVMDCVRLYAPLSRADLAARTGLMRSTISLIMDELIGRSFVREIHRQESKIGRPGTLLEVNPNAGFAVGLEIGVDFLSVIVTNFVGEILWRQTRAAPESQHQIAKLEQVEQVIAEALEAGKRLGLRPLGIGVGVPGLVDAEQGKLVFAPNLHWMDVPLRLIWMRRFGLPVFVENEANCACLGEYFYGNARNIGNFIFLKTGVGLGGGVMIGGKLFRGANGFGGEVGHMALYKGGELCACGRQGCWETYVRPSHLYRDVILRLKDGNKSMIADLVGGDLDRITMDEIIEAAKQGDKVVLSVLEDYARHLAVGICNLINIFNPELVILGGTLSGAGQWLVPVINASMQQNVLPPLRNITRIEVSARGEDACLLGAIALVLDDILREPLG